jgi:hypothetical protein
MLINLVVTCTCIGRIERRSTIDNLQRTIDDEFYQVNQQDWSCRNGYCLLIVIIRSDLVNTSVIERSMATNDISTSIVKLQLMCRKQNAIVGLFVHR